MKTEVMLEVGCEGLQMYTNYLQTKAGLIISTRMHLGRKLCILLWTINITMHQLHRIPRRWTSS